MSEFLRNHRRLVRGTLAFVTAAALGPWTVACDDSKPDGNNNNVAPSPAHTQSTECPRTRSSQLEFEVAPPRNGHPVHRFVGQAACKRLKTYDGTKGLPYPETSLILGEQDSYEVTCMADAPERLVVIPIKQPVDEKPVTILLYPLTALYMQFYDVPRCPDPATPPPIRSQS